jgi:UDP-2-acetamido-3-amino-2,3-dideoxy-glucuronate N-acetyltransferase
VQWGTGCEVVTPINAYRCKVGNNVKIGPFVEIQADVVVGDCSVISSHSFICSGTKIGKNVFIGHGVLTCNDKYPVVNNADYKCEPPIIEDNASVGSGAVILPGVRIGAGATIGAGAVVAKDVERGTIVKGGRAR